MCVKLKKGRMHSDAVAKSLGTLDALEIPYYNQNIIEEAFVHSSYVNESDKKLTIMSVWNLWVMPFYRYVCQNGCLCMKTV